MSAYLKLEKVLKRASQPLTCTDLFEKTEINSLEEIASPDDVSDRLGYMWRRGLLTRQPAPRKGAKSARYAYSWRSDAEQPAVPKTIDDIKIGRVVGQLDIQKKRDGSVVFTTEDFEITVRRK